MTVKTSREVSRGNCTACEASGHIEQQERVTCGTCKGYGWHTGYEGEEELCPDCNGDGFLLKDTTVPCEACEGRGYEVTIWEISEDDEFPCPECNGKTYAVKI